MKNSLACPKCDSHRVWQIEKLKFTDKDDQHVFHRYLRVALGRKIVGGARSGWKKLWYGDHATYTAGFIDAWICAVCGYTELWSQGIEALVESPDDGVHLHDTTPQQAQYR